MEHGEILTEIQVPPLPAKTGVAYAKFNVIETEMPTVSAAVAITLGSGGVCRDARIALGAAAPIPLRARKAEEVLKGKKVTGKLLHEAGVVASGEADPLSDINASAEYRRELVRAMVKKVGAEALDGVK
jgi:carbon-monoxide dehydrogenase medium subunit